jgi:hypothetical protein
VKPSALKIEHPALHLARLDLDPDLQYGSSDPTESGSNPDPDPQHCFSDPSPPKPFSSYLCLSELQILATSVDHGVAGDLEEGGPLI